MRQYRRRRGQPFTVAKGINLVKSILFFDDFLIHRGPDIERRIHTPRWLDQHAYTDPETSYGMGYASVVPGLDGGFLLYYVTVSGTDTSDAHGTNWICMAASEDGLSWQPVDTGHAPAGLPPRVLTAGTPKPAGCWVIRDPGPTPRYLMTNSPIRRAADGIGLDPEPSIILESADGFDWHQIPDSTFLPHHSDTCNALVWNPIRKRYQLTLRRRWGERRIYQTESDDLTGWSASHPVIHPDTIDPRSTHFYGMPQFYLPTAGIFVGFLWRQHMPYNDAMGGPVTTEYAYSYDGDLWNRTHSASMPRRETGAYGAGSMYGTAMIESGDEMIVYAVARLEEHGSIRHTMETGKTSGVLLPGRLRKHGFVGLYSNRARGEITTENLLLDRPEISLNVNAPLGGVRVQLCTPDYRPIDGCSYADCEEIVGDHTGIRVRWTDQRRFTEAVESKRWLRIQIQLEHAEIFSIDTEGAFSINEYAPIRREL